MRASGSSSRSVRNSVLHAEVLGKIGILSSAPKQKPLLTYVGNTLLLRVFRGRCTNNRFVHKLIRRHAV